MFPDNKLKNTIVKSELHIRFSDASISDIVKIIENKGDLSKINVKYLRDLVRNNDPKLHEYTKNRKLRFIYNGKPISSLTGFKESLENFERLIAADHNEGNDELFDNQDGSNRPLLSNGSISSPKVIMHKVYIHCIIGDILTPDELAAEDQNEDNALRYTQQRRVLEGFDRLLNIGFSEEEVANFRRQFMTAQQNRFRRNNANDLDEEYDTDDDDYGNDDDYDQVVNQANQRGTPQTVNNTSPEDTIRRMEETWLENSAENPEMDPNRTRGFLRFGLSQEGQTDNKNIFFGILIGSIFGITSLLLLKDEFRFLNRQTRHAIVIGAIINVFFALLLQLTE